MNILTKICVVVLLVLVLVASTVFINMATITPNWRYYFDQEKQRRVLMEQGLRYEKLHVDRLNMELRDAQKRSQDLAGELATLQKAKVPGPEELRSAQLEAAIQQANTKLAELGATVKAMSERNDRLVAQLDEKRQVVTGLQDQSRRTRAQLTQVEGKLERSERVVRALTQQLQDREERVKELERIVAQGGRGPTTAPGEEGVPTSAGAKIAGTITAVRGELASLNVGASQGVTSGTKLIIYRDSRFVGYLRITEVDESESAGIIQDRQLDPLAGDKVTNDLTK